MDGTRWIGIESDQFTAGETGFLVELHHVTKGWRRFELRSHPPRTNMSFVPRLHGWCGTSNDVACHAHGMAVVERVARNGRAFVRELDGEELHAALDDLGYPELA